MEHLAELRESRGLTLRELAKMSGVSPDTINQIELGHRKARPSTLRKLARALQVEIEELTARPKGLEPPLSFDVDELRINAMRQGFQGREQQDQLDAEYARRLDDWSQDELEAKQTELLSRFRYLKEQIKPPVVGVSVEEDDALYAEFGRVADELRAVMVALHWRVNKVIQDVRELARA